MDKIKQAKSVYFTKDNMRYITTKVAQTGCDFSTIVNEIIKERRYNEQFYPCQNEF